MQSQPLDVYVGASIKNTLQYYLNALPDFSDFLLSDTTDPRLQDRLWASLEEDEDEHFYVVVERTIKEDSLSLSASHRWMIKAWRVKMRSMSTGRLCVMII